MPVTTKEQLQRIVEAARRLKELGDKPNMAQVEAAAIQYYDHLLKEVICRGKGTVNDVMELVEFHWPHLLDEQEMAIDWWQCRLIRDILSGMYTDLNELAVKGCTKAGKGFSLAIAACLWFQASPSCKVVVTSYSSDHAKTTLFAEIVTCRSSMKYACPGRNGVIQVKAASDKTMEVASPEAAEGLSGKHASRVLFLFDEASGCSKEHWDQALTQADMAVAASNPRKSTGWFRLLYPEGEADKNQIIEIAGGRRALHTIGGMDCINVKTGRKVIPSQITRSRYESIKANKNPTWGRVMGDGKFPEEDGTLMLVLPSWTGRHLDGWYAKLPANCFGLDVAASENGDRTILSSGGSGGCAEQLELQETNTMKVVDWVLRVAEERYSVNLRNGANPVTVDMDGIGKGVGDALKQQGVWVIEFHGSAGAEDKRNHGNMRAEGYASLGDRLNPEGSYPDAEFALPRFAYRYESATGSKVERVDNEELVEDLAAAEKLFGNDGIQFKIIPKTKPKADYKGITIFEKIGRSPDRGDSLVYLYQAVRAYEKNRRWRQQHSGDLTTSGTPEADRAFSDEELEELDDTLRDIIEGARSGYRDEDDFDFDDEF